MLNHESVRLFMALLFSLSASSHNRAAAAVISFQDWACGSGETSREISYNAIAGSCPEYAVEVNHCCVVHDDCYGRQLGQKYCDEQFCLCNERVTNQTGARGCRETTDFACTILHFMGSVAYGDSVNYTEPEVLEGLCTAGGELTNVFEGVYQSCNTTKSIVSSCCMQLRSCSTTSALAHSPLHCAEKASVCLEEAAAITRQHECSHAIGRASAAIERAAVNERYNFIHSNTAFVLLLVLSLSCSLALLLITYKYYRLRSLHENECKYMAVDETASA